MVIFQFGMLVQQRDCTMPTQARIDIDKSGARCKVRLTGSQAQRSGVDRGHGAENRVMGKGWLAMANFRKL